MACEKAAGGPAERSGIGTLAEKTLHAALKLYFEPDESKHEIKIGRYIADIAGDSGIIEIQTRSFNRLREKLAAFLECSDVTVVYPIARTKYLRWIDTQSGHATEKRKSPKLGRYYDAFAELYKIKPLLSNPRLRLCLVLIDLTEYRCLDGWSKDKKKGSTRYERIPENLAGELFLRSAADYAQLIPPELPRVFTAKEFAACAHISPAKARAGLNLLNSVGAVIHVGKRGREYEYTRSEE